MRAVVVIPCFNEARRLEVGSVMELTGVPGHSVICVDDGSTDGTLRCLQEIAHLNPAVEVIGLTANVGKAEAVRQGLIAALARSPAPDVVAFADADFATPAGEVLRVVDEALRPGVSAALGSRIGMAGSQIERSPARHYLGRVFATLASTALAGTYYDTQCGAKAFKDSPQFRRSIASPFRTRWIFDVELLGRLEREQSMQPAVPPESIVEVPLLRWRDVSGSKLSSSDKLRALWDLMTIYRLSR